MLDTGRVFEIITRINQLNVERDKLDIEYNELVNELYELIPSLRSDPNIQPKEKVKRK